MITFIIIIKQTSLQFLQQINVKNAHLVYGAGIWTKDLWFRISSHNH